MERLVANQNELPAVPRHRDRDPVHARADAIPWPELVVLVRKSMRSIAGPSADLEDLTQSALEHVLRSVGRFEGRAELSTFVYRICVRVALNHWRWWKRWMRRFELGIDSAGDAADPAQEVREATMERARARRLHELLERIPPMRRIVLTLIDFEELPASHVADIVGCPEATVRSRLRQGRIELEALILRDPFFRDELAGGSR